MTSELKTHYVAFLILHSLSFSLCKVDTVLLVLTNINAVEERQRYRHQWKTEDHQRILLERLDLQERL